MIGITAYGAHIPRYRLERKRIAQAMSWINSATLGLATGEKAVANVDEDAVTLAVAAARNALATAPDLNATQLFVASTTLPYLERQNSAIAAAALNLTPETETADVTGSFRSGTTALIQALRSLENGGSGGVLVAAADKRTAKPGSAEEHMAADAGAAVAVGTEDLMAVFRGALSLTADFPDRMRDCSQRFSRTWEERWIRDEGYLKIIPRAIAAFFERQGTDAKAYQKIAYPCPFPREHAAIAKALNIDPQKVVDPLTATVGDTGSAHPLLLLVHALEQAEPGDNLLVVGFGSGADVLHFQATDRIRDRRPALPLARQIERKALLSSYEKALAFRNVLPVETGLRGEFQAESPRSIMWRHRDTILGLVGSRCRHCGTPQYPPQRICAVPDCNAVDAMDPYPFASRTGRIVSYTADHLAFSYDPPQIYGIVDFDGGGRMMLDFTDCSLEDLQVGMPVNLAFRRKYLDKERGIHVYFWKAVPAAS